MSGAPALPGPGANLYSYVLNNPLNLIDPFGLDWEYSQSKGSVTHVDNKTGARTPAGSGYSGTGPGLNNPSQQSTPDVGPIPQGSYTIGPQTNSPNTGPGVLPLTPDPGTNTFGRNAFQIHGDNAQGNQSASEGCIVTGPGVRNKIAGSGDNTLVVVP